MRFSVNLMPDAPPAEVASLAAHAEQLGCARCWVYDEGLVTRDVYVTLAAIAATTEHMPIGPGITNPYVRHPGATAAAIATLDELSGGRAFVGLGAGGGLTLGPLAIERVRPLTTVIDMVAALRGLFAGDTVDHDGVFAFASASLSYGRPGIQIMLAGRGPKMLEAGAAHADGFYLSYLHKDLLGGAAQVLRAGARARGREDFLITYSTLIATTDRELDEARAQLSFRLVDSPVDVKDRIGMGEADTLAIRRALAEGGPAAAGRHVRPEWVDSFVISGTVEECAVELRDLMTTHGIDEFQLPVSSIATGAPLIDRTAAMFADDRS